MCERELTISRCGTYESCGGLIGEGETSVKLKLNGKAEGEVEVQG